MVNLNFYGGNRANPRGPLILLLLLLASFSHAQSVTLGWDLNPVTTSPLTKAIGYKLHIGTAPGVYIQTVDTKMATRAVVSATAGTQYYAVVKAYNAAGIESPASLQLAYTLPSSTPTGITNGTTIPIAIGTTKVTVLTAGTYKLVGGGILAPDVARNSFWIDFDQNPAGDNTRCWDFKVASTTQSVDATWRGVGGNENLATIHPKTWVLSAGVHSIFVSNRETGTVIKSIQFVKVN